MLRLAKDAFLDGLQISARAVTLYFVSRLSPEEIAQLSVAERVQLAEDIWDSIAADPASLPITEAQKLELDRRLSTFEAEPSRTEPWSEVRGKLDQRR